MCILFVSSHFCEKQKELPFQMHTCVYFSPLLFFCTKRLVKRIRNEIDMDIIIGGNFEYFLVRILISQFRKIISAFNFQLLCRQLQKSSFLCIGAPTQNIGLSFLFLNGGWGNVYSFNLCIFIHLAQVGGNKSLNWWHSD